MIFRIHLFIYSRRLNRNCAGQLFFRYYSSRHILRSSSLPLCLINRCSICSICRIYILISLVFRHYSSSIMIKNSFFPNIHWGQYNFFPPTLLRLKGYAPPIFRLPGPINKMEHYFIYRVNNFFNSFTILHLYLMRSLRIAARNYFNNTPKLFIRMTRFPTIRLSQYTRNNIINIPSLICIN